MLAKMKVPLGKPSIERLSGLLQGNQLVSLDCMKKENSEYWFCPSLFQIVSDLGNLTNLLSAVLLEKQIICYGKSLHMVSGVLMGLESLIRPFRWQGALIPILPKMLLDYLEAPIPMLAGITKA